jgi:hypothetical protein
MRQRPGQARGNDSQPGKNKIFTRVINEVEKQTTKNKSLKRVTCLPVLKARTEQKNGASYHLQQITSHLSSDPFLSESLPHKRYAFSLDH